MCAWHALLHVKHALMPLLAHLVTQLPRALHNFSTIIGVSIHAQVVSLTAPLIAQPVIKIARLAKDQPLTAHLVTLQQASLIYREVSV